MDNQHGPTIQQKELCSILCGSLDGRRVWGRMDTCTCMAELLCCALETITTLLISYACVLSRYVMSNSLRPHVLQPARLLCPWDFPGKNTGVGCHFLLQEIVPTQGSNLHLLHWQADSLPLNHQGSQTWVVGNKLGAWDKHTYTTIYKIDNQQGPTI